MNQLKIGDTGSQAALLQKALARAGEPLAALICVALFGLVVSPVSWSHHWVWVLPALVMLTVLARRHRDRTVGALALLGAVLLTGAPLLALLPEHHEAEASWWRQLIGTAYLWWAVAVIGVAAVRPGRADRANVRPADQPATRSEIRSGSS